MVELSYTREDICDKDDPHCADGGYLFSEGIRIAIREAILVHLYSIVRALNSGDVTQCNHEKERKTIHKAANAIKDIIDGCISCGVSHNDSNRFFEAINVITCNNFSSYGPKKLPEIEECLTK